MSHPVPEKQIQHFDVFNGDADGICSLVQLRLNHPKSSQLITGVKRDIALLGRVSPNSGDQITVLDVSMLKNAQYLANCLMADARVFYADHHLSGEIPDHPSLEAHIHTDSATCTSLIISRLLDHEYAEWAIAGAFGDNMTAPATALARTKDISESDCQALQELGQLINYNGYGENLEDLHFHPADLYKELVQHQSPLDTLETETIGQLRAGYIHDRYAAEAVDATHQSESVGIYVLPNEKWARRMSGPFGNLLANKYPARAHAVVTTKLDGNYQVSIRAPINNPFNAEKVAQAFPEGGGRKRAAGINRLPPDQLDALIKLMEETYE